ncbi:hypothetical protein QQF64_031455 [Cirrhinus molitorella]|uniref:Uncharacterized protein n=1 Tax=Cirrhinus molitorella TaxID=172907 RepID=A0ABR3MX47_9TELE
MYSCILVVSGGLLFHGAQEFLQHRILNKMPPSFHCLVENVDVITRPKWDAAGQSAAVQSVMFYMISILYSKGKTAPIETAQEELAFIKP